MNDNDPQAALRLLTVERDELRGQVERLRGVCSNVLLNLEPTDKRLAGLTYGQAMFKLRVVRDSLKAALAETEPKE